MAKKIFPEKTDTDMPNALRIDFYQAIVEILQSARRNAYRAVNFAMVEAYWNVGRMIVEEEQQGKERAEYGCGMLKNLAVRLTVDFGEPFSERNLRNFRQFYICFPIRNALRSESGLFQDVATPLESEGAGDGCEGAVCEIWRAGEIKGIRLLCWLDNK